MIFDERLSKLRKETGLNQKDFANDLKIDPSKYNKWENGKTVPDFATVIKLAKRFDVTVDYLVGNSDVKRWENADISEKTGLSEKAVEMLVGIESIQRTINKISAGELSRTSDLTAEKIGAQKVSEIMNSDMENDISFQTVLSEFIANNRFYDFFIELIDYSFDKILLDQYENILKAYFAKNIDNALIKKFYGSGSFDDFEDLGEIAQESAISVIEDHFTNSITGKLFKDQRSNGDHECLSFLFYKEVQKILDSLTMKYKEEIIDTKKYQLQLAKLSNDIDCTFKEIVSNFYE